MRSRRRASTSPSPEVAAAPLASVREAVRYCARPAHLRRTAMIAVVVGTVLTHVNEGDLLLSGAATAAMAVKVAANYLTPFLVSNLGLLSGRRSTRAGG